MRSIPLKKGTGDWEEGLLGFAFAFDRAGRFDHEFGALEEHEQRLRDRLEQIGLWSLVGIVAAMQLSIAAAQILLTTEKESEQMRLQTEEDCAELRSRAEAAALEAR